MTKDNKKKMKRDYDVGYAKPPKESQFKKGESGNLKGRPKSAKGVLASLKRELESKITVQEGNRTERITKAEAMAKQLMNKALKGDIRAMITLLRLDPELYGDAVAYLEADAGLSEQAPEPVDYEILRHFFSQPNSNKVHGDAPMEQSDIDDAKLDYEEQDSDAS